MNKRSLALGVLCTAAFAAHADVITFNEHADGTIITDQYFGSHGLVISADNPNRQHDVAAIFDSHNTHTTDDDLIGPPVHDWAGGNISTQDLGNLLILAENIVDRNEDGILDDPDDEGRRPAGSFLFDFTSDPILEFGFDFVDVERAEQGGYYTKFYKEDDLLATVSFADYMDPGSPYYDPSLGFGNNTANVIPTVTAESVGSDVFDKVEMHLGGSGGVTNLRFTRIPPPPPPPTVTVPVGNTMWHLLLGLGLCCFVRRRFS